MDYAIIQLGGKQYRVSVGDSLTVDKVTGAAEQKTLKVNDVLFVRNGKDLKVGLPFVDGAAVTLEHVTEAKGEKIRVFKYKSKSRYRRTQGHRQHQSVFTVKSITA